MKKFIISLSIMTGALLWTVSSACSDLTEYQFMKEKSKALKIGEKFVIENYADFDRTDKTPTVKDKGKHWEFSYELPNYMIGGSPVINIEKNTMRIIKSYRTQ